MESVATVSASGSRSAQFLARQDPKFKARYRRPWPQNLVFFAQLEDVLRGVLGDSRYRECWRGLIVISMMMRGGWGMWLCGVWMGRVVASQTLEEKDVYDSGM